MSYTRIPGGGDRGVLSPFSHPFSPFSHFLPPLFSLLPPLVSFLTPLLFSFLPATFSFLPPSLFLPSLLSFLPPPLSFLPPPLLPAPTTLSIPFVRIVPGGPVFFFVLFCFCEQSRIPLKGDPTLDKTLVSKEKCYKFKCSLCMT